MDFDKHLFQKFSSLRYDPNAKSFACLIPLSSIYWSDEMPEDFPECFREYPKEKDWVYTMLTIRREYWINGYFDEKSLEFWNEA